MENPQTTKSGTADARLRVMFAPDFREYGPYQQLLHEALAGHGADVEYLTGYRRGMPLFRGLQGREMDILHLHYPVHYYERYNKWNGLRKLRFPIDLHLSTIRAPLVYTVHDLFPLDGGEDFLSRVANGYAVKRAAAVIIHSEGVRKLMESVFGHHGEKCTVIPHGDLSPVYGEPVAADAARRQLGLEDLKTCLVFGILTPNKGVEEIIEFWKRTRPDALLAVVGSIKDPAYGRSLRALAGAAHNILMEFEFQTDEQVRLWFSAADCVVINYGKVFTSGVASLARSYGVPVLLAKRHATVDLHEPHPSVFRFDSVEGDFGERLKSALQYTPSYAVAAAWRKAISWDAIARQTRKVYDQVLS